MKVSSAVYGTALLAASALAAPLTAQRQARQEARRVARASGRHSHPPYKPGTKDVLSVNKSVQEQYSSNWAGAALIGTGYTGVTGEFTVPTPRFHLVVILAPSTVPLHGLELTEILAAVLFCKPVSTSVFKAAP